MTATDSWTPPAGVARLMATMLAHKWNYRIEHGTDSGENAFVTVTGIHPIETIRSVKATWHTREHGTYRLFSCMRRVPYQGWCDCPLSKAIADVDAS